MRHAHTTRPPHYRLSYPDEGGAPRLNDPRICEALEAVARGHAVLFTPLPDGRFAVDISYGATDRDQATREAFDCAEWGIGASPTQALRFALGAHYGYDYEYDKAEGYITDVEKGDQ